MKLEVYFTKLLGWLRKQREYTAISPFACILTNTAQIQGLKPTSPVEPQMKQWQTDDRILLCIQETPQQGEYTSANFYTDL